jgi:hypothetical protein
MNQKDKIIKYTAFCGKRNADFTAHFKNLVGILVA